jgi:hypothetical protein
MKKYDMAVKTGTYQTNNGEKNRYENVGEIHAGKDGGFYARVNPFRMVGIAMAAIAKGEDSMLVSLFEPKQDAQGKKQNAAPADDFDQDIPF